MCPRHGPCHASSMLQKAIGIAASVLLVATIATQIYKQHKEGSSKGVSRWLFLGQLGASIGFTIYSAMLRDAIFVFTNALMVVSALAGYVITLRFKRRERDRRGRGETPAGTASVSRNAEAAESPSAA